MVNDSALYVPSMYFFCTRYYSRNQSGFDASSRQYESAMNKEHPDGSYATILQGIRDAINAKPEFGVEGQRWGIKQIFTDVELAHYMVRRDFSKCKDVRHCCYIYYRRQCYKLSIDVELARDFKDSTCATFEVIEHSNKCFIM